MMSAPLRLVEPYESGSRRAELLDIAALLLDLAALPLDLVEHESGEPVDLSVVEQAVRAAWTSMRRSVRPSPAKAAPQLYRLHSS